jgi:hypothetical protein
MKIGFVPIDNRPVCYTLPAQIAAIDRNIELLMPERKWLGDLEKGSDVERILAWLEGLPEVDALVISLDTIAYGGLIPSRRSPDSFEEVDARIERLKPLLKGRKVYAFSSIMRISNNNINEEEKEYWAQWGKAIFEYSYSGRDCGIPARILEDYFATRKRNFEINKIYLEWQKQGLFDTLVFSKDDCAECGCNVEEARELEALGAFVKTGADEIPLTLLARAVNQPSTLSSPARPPQLSTLLKIAPVFLEPEYKHLISNYEDISIEQSVKGQIELAGCTVCAPQDADLLLYVNNFIDRQGEIVMKVPTEPFAGVWPIPPAQGATPLARGAYMSADVRFANGADNKLVEQITVDKDFYGYSAWNTSANTLGSLICAAVILRHSEPLGEESLEAFKRLQAVRFLDDWAYQANVRQELSGPDLEQLKAKMKPYEERVFKMLDFHANIDYKFPWNRLFEVEIEFN